jgi:hypothetical protein
LSAASIRRYTPCSACSMVFSTISLHTRFRFSHFTTPAHLFDYCVGKAEQWS